MMTWRRAKGVALAFLGAHLITFILLFVAYGALGVGEPPHSGGKGLPLFVNPAMSGSAQVTETLLFSRAIGVLGGDFGHDRAGRGILDEVSARLPVSLALIGVPLFVALLAASLCVAGWVIAELKFKGLTRRFALPLGALAALAATVWPAHWLLDATWRFVLAAQLAEYGASVLLGASLASGVLGGWWWVRTAWEPAWHGAAANTGLLLGLDRRTVLASSVVPAALRRGMSTSGWLVGGLFALDLLLETVFEVRGLGRYAVEAFHTADVSALQALILMGVLVHLLIRLVVESAITEVEA